jgi:hypothetical protein
METLRARGFLKESFAVLCTAAPNVVFFMTPVKKERTPLYEAGINKKSLSFLTSFSGK